MRRVLVIITFMALLLAIDAVANDFRFTATVLLELREFGRLVNRFVGHAFDFLA